MLTKPMNPITRTERQQSALQKGNPHCLEPANIRNGARRDLIWRRPGTEPVRPDLDNQALIEAIEWQHIRRGLPMTIAELDALAELRGRAWTWTDLNRARVRILPTWADELIPARRQGWTRFLAALLAAYRSGAVGVWLGYHECLSLTGMSSTSTWRRWTLEMEDAGLVRLVQTWQPDAAEGGRPRKYGKILYRLGPAWERYAGPGLLEGAEIVDDETTERWAAAAAAGARKRAAKARDVRREKLWPSRPVDPQKADEVDSESKEPPREIGAHNPDPDAETEHEKTQKASMGRADDDRTTAGRIGGDDAVTKSIDVHDLKGNCFSILPNHSPPPSSGGELGPRPTAGLVAPLRSREGRPSGRCPAKPATRLIAPANADSAKRDKPARIASGNVPAKLEPVRVVPSDRIASAIDELIGQLESRGLPCQRGPKVETVRPKRETIAERDPDFRVAQGDAAPLKHPDLSRIDLSPVPPDPAPPISYPTTEVVKCSACRGLGQSPSLPFPCVPCAGRGKIKRRVDPPCGSCHGSGLNREFKACSQCGGAGRVPAETSTSGD